jgi:NADH-quinone oxidoreductase subunit J
MAEALLFYVFGSLAVLLGALVVALKNPVHSAVALIGNLFLVAGLFAMLDAHFLAAIQVLVYAGAILVLFLFVIMLLNLRDEELGAARRTLLKWLAAVAVLGSGAVGVVVLIRQPVSALGALPEGFGTIETIGRLLFGRYLLPFEASSIILLSAILGAVAIAKRELW